MSEVFLKVTNINKAFAGVQALKNVNLTINKGEICCLAGENGSGKSTLIKIIAGAYKPDNGEIEINAKRITRSCLKILFVRVSRSSIRIFRFFPI